MLWGMGWSGYWGHPDDMVAPVADRAMFADMRDGVRAVFDVVTGYPQYYRLVIDGVPSGPPIYGRAGQPNQMSGLYESADTAHAVSIVPQGGWPGEDIEVSGQQILFLTGKSDKLFAQITAVPTIFSYGESGQLTSWSLSGLKRFTNVRPYVNWRNWAQLDLTLTNAGGTYTVTVSLNSLTICSGSRVGNGSITLAEANSSGVSGSVTVAYTADVTSGAYVISRWPERFAIHYRTGADWSAPDFPRTAEAYLLDDGHANIFDWRGASLAAGTYKATVHQRDENANESTGTTTTAVVLSTPPGAPGQPAYSSGGAAATIISFTASSTAGATYNIYDSLATGTLDVNTIAATRIAGTGTLTQTLAAIGLGYTGLRYVLVRALNGGVEEGSLKILTLEYAAGVIVLPRPPRPGPRMGVTVSGRTLTVQVSVDHAEQAGTPATIELFVVAAGAAFNYSGAQASVAIGATTNGMSVTSISYLHGSNADVDFAVRTVTSGATQSNNTERYGPVRLTTAVPLDPTFAARSGF